MRRPSIILILLAAAIVPVTALAVLYGSESVSFGDVFRILLDPFFSTAADVPRTERLIILNLRLPRALGAFVVGGGLAIIGVAMQALVRNPLAEPYVLGISSGASAGASLFYLGFIPPIVATWLSVPVAAFLGALISITLVYLVARSDGYVSVSRLLLAGVAMAALMGAVTSFITYLSPDPNRIRIVIFWLLGSLNGFGWSALPLSAAASLAGLACLLFMSRHLDAFLLGEEPASGLGVHVESMKKLLIVLAAFVTGILVAHSGVIGFVGLIVPHIVRSWTGIAHRFVLPASYLLGGVFLIGADLVARVVMTGQVLPIGIVTAMAGVPYFLWLLRKSQYRFN